MLSVEGECVYELYDECPDRSPSTRPSSAPSRSPTMSPTERDIVENDDALVADDATVPLVTVMLILVVVFFVCSIVSVGACAYYRRKAKQMENDVANLAAMELHKTQKESEAAPDMEAGKNSTAL